MDFSLTICRQPSRLFQASVVFILVYGIWCLAVLVRRRSSRPAFLAVIPFLVGLPVVWSSYINVMRGMAISAGGPASTAAGFADALTMLTVVAIASALLATVATIRGPRGGDMRASAAGVLIPAILAGVTVWFARAVANREVDLAALDQFSPALILTAVVIVATSVALLLRGLSTSPIAVAVIMAAIAFLAFAQAAAFEKIAMGVY